MRQVAPRQYRFISLLHSVSFACVRKAYTAYRIRYTSEALESSSSSSSSLSFYLYFGRANAVSHIPIKLRYDFITILTLFSFSFFYILYTSLPTMPYVFLSHFILSSQLNLNNSVYIHYLYKENFFFFFCRKFVK